MNKRQDKEDKFRVATTLFLMIGLLFVLVSIAEFQDDHKIFGFLYLTGGILSLVSGVWAEYQLFFPVLIGALIYAVFLVIIIFYQTQYVTGRSGIKVVSFLFLGFAFILSALKTSYDDWKKSKGNLS